MWMSEVQGSSVHTGGVAAILLRGMPRGSQSGVFMDTPPGRTLGGWSMSSLHTRAQSCNQKVTPSCKFGALNANHRVEQTTRQQHPKVLVLRIRRVTKGPIDG